MVSRIASTSRIALVSFSKASESCREPISVHLNIFGIQSQHFLSSYLFASLSRFDGIAPQAQKMPAFCKAAQREWRRSALIVKTKEPHGANQMKILAILLVCITPVLADDFKTMDGREYKGATVTRVEPDGIVVKTKTGISKLYFVELPQPVQQRFHYDQQQARAYSAEQAAAYSTMQTDQNGVENQFEGIAPQEQPGVNKQEPQANTGAPLQRQPTGPFYPPHQCRCWEAS